MIARGNSLQVLANPNKTLGLWKTLVVPTGVPEGTLAPDLSEPGDVIAEPIQYSDATRNVPRRMGRSSSNERPSFSAG